MGPLGRPADCGPCPARPASAGALALQCGFRDSLRKLNPFSKQSKSEQVRRQWDERSSAVDVSGLAPAPPSPDPSAPKPPPFPSPPPYKSRLRDPLEPGTGSTKLQQELAAREAERLRAWSAPVPTETAKTALFESAGDAESPEDRRRRQEAAAQDIERVLGKKLLQQREQEAAQPELDNEERREIAVCAPTPARLVACACARVPPGAVQARRAAATVRARASGHGHL